MTLYQQRVKTSEGFSSKTCKYLIKLAMGALIDLFTGIHVGTVRIKVNNYLHLRKHHWNQDLTGPENINLFYKVYVFW